MALQISKFGWQTLLFARQTWDSLYQRHQRAIKEPQIGQMQKDDDDKKINTNQQNLAVTDDDDGAFAFVFVFVFKFCKCKYKH